MGLAWNAGELNSPLKRESSYQLVKLAYDGFHLTPYSYSFQAILDPCKMLTTILLALLRLCSFQAF